MARTGGGAGPALVLVATPIGNLGDLSPRARIELERADAIACEDTRRTGKLLDLEGIPANGRMVVLNDHTEGARAPELVARVERGERVVVVSDAGMPGISDPGERLVRAAVGAGVRVEVVPGPSAGLTALVASGLPTGRFVFEGFLPRRGAERAERLAAVAAESRTVVLYEAPHRLARTVADLAAACGGSRRVALARELTKLHEEVWRGSLDEAQSLDDLAHPRGEYVLVLEGAPPPAAAGPDAVLAALEVARRGGASTRDAVATVAAELGVPKRDVYALAVAARDAEDNGEGGAKHDPSREDH